MALLSNFIIGYAMFLMILQRTCSTAAYTVTESPVETYVQLGDNGHFSCVVEESTGTTYSFDWYIEWFNDTQDIRKTFARENGTISDEDRPEFFGRGVYTTRDFPMATTTPGIISHRFVLMINEITTRDNGYFGFTQRLPTTNTRVLVAEKVRLVVVEPAPYPLCEHSLNVADGVNVLTCVSIGGNPSAKLSWHNSSGTPLHDATWTAETVTIQVPVDLSLARMYQCRAQQGTLSPRTCGVTLDANSQQQPTTSSTMMANEETTPQTTSSSATTTSMPPTSSSIPDKQNLLIMIIIASVVAVVLILICCILVPFLCCCRKKKARRQSEAPIVDTTQLPELPTLDHVAHPPVEENPYGERPGTSSSPYRAYGEEEEEEPEPDLKPWKNNPDYFLQMDNDGFTTEDDFTSDDDAADDGDEGNSATESYSGGNAIYDTPCD